MRTAVVIGRPTQDPEVHDILQLYAVRREFRCLPGSGGINDQDHLLMRKLLMVADAFREKESRKKSGT